jgi:diguanylate cyclase (GGDEF)-like protein
MSGLMLTQNNISLRSTSADDTEPDRTNRNILLELITKNNLTSHFQPIISLEQGIIFAFEALCRTVGPNPFETIDNLFLQARLHDLILQLDMRCRENGINLAGRQGISRRDILLFLNICPTSLAHPGRSDGTTEEFVKQSGIRKENIVLEITEQEAISNYSLFRKAIDHYRNQGFRIAIDDFGAGYGGLKMLSVIEPDYVKIDQHFFRNHQKNHINYNLIDAIATACHRIGIDVIAEGIENENDLRVCREIGINLLQGYLFAKPAPELIEPESLNLHIIPSQHISGTKLFDEIICIGDISEYVVPASVDDRVMEVLEQFNSNPKLVCLPVLCGGLLCGLINRNRFMENHMVGRNGYGLSLNYYKKVGDVLEKGFLQVPHYMSVEDVARKINLRQQLSMYDDICVLRSGKYHGTVSVSAILNAVTENSMMLAKGANPLTGLPGNEFIQRQIAHMLSQSLHFDVCYIDIDCFKPFNDRHGFEMGDRVIKKVGEILMEAVKRWDKSTIGFAGHIGGDDFIIVSRPKYSVSICEYIIEQFTRAGKTFHTEEEFRNGFYYSIDRHGQQEKFNLLSLSIGIVSTEIHHITSFAEVSSLASDLKKRAKKIDGSVIIRDRREN